VIQIFVFLREFAQHVATIWSKNSVILAQLMSCVAKNQTTSAQMSITIFNFSDFRLIKRGCSWQLKRSSDLFSLHVKNDLLMMLLITQKRGRKVVYIIQNNTHIII
jgi:hypothetical protein